MISLPKRTCCRIWLAGVFATFPIWAGCGVFSNPVDYSAPAIIEYAISGGVLGIHVEITVNETGFAELIQGTRGGQRFVIQSQLSESQWGALKTTFDAANFFGLRNEYKPSYSVADGFSYAISYTAEGRTKTVTVKDGADYPKKLEDLLLRGY